MKVKIIAKYILNGNKNKSNTLANKKARILLCLNILLIRRKNESNY